MRCLFTSALVPNVFPHCSHLCTFACLPALFCLLGRGGLMTMASMGRLNCWICGGILPLLPLLFRGGAGAVENGCGWCCCCCCCCFAVVGMEIAPPPPIATTPPTFGVAAFEGWPEAPTPPKLFDDEAAVAASAALSWWGVKNGVKGLRDRIFAAIVVAIVAFPAPAGTPTTFIGVAHTPCLCCCCSWPGWPLLLLLLLLFIGVDWLSERSDRPPSPPQPSSPTCSSNP
mmetsp:Transcript_8005/g.12746  ORF Transcript_8005/g.12746 Transcript_8005/m.12746 type:complete len:229 (+) Transcript_8005:308-994(+)